MKKVLYTFTGVLKDPLFLVPVCTFLAVAAETAVAALVVIYG